MWENFKNAIEGSGVIDLLISSGKISLVAYGLVLWLGAMMHFIYYYRTKNMIATAVMIVYSGIFTYNEIGLEKISETLYLYSVVLTFSFIWYVIVWMRFRSRADKFQDSKIGLDSKSFYKGDFKKPTRRNNGKTKKT